MRSIVRAGLALGICLFGAALPAYGHSPTDPSIGKGSVFAEWRTLETRHFNIHFQSRHLAFAQRMAAIAEQVYGKTTQWMQWEPKDKTDIVINDAFDGSNGGASPLPYNRFFVYMNAPVEGQLLTNAPWLEQVFTHEFIHVLHLDQVSKFPGFLRKVLGRQFFTFPQIFSPKWVIEGIAVYGETDHAKRIGRGQSAMYDAMMRAEVMNGLRSVTEMSYHGYQGTDWPQGQVYLYGYYFFEFIEARYGKEKVVDYIRNWNKNIVPWRMDARAQQVFRVSGEELWEQFVEYLNTKFQPDIEALLAGQTETDQLIAKNGHIVDNPVWLSNGDFYFHENDGRRSSRIVRKTHKGRQYIPDIEGFVMFDVSDRGDILLSKAEICDNTNVYADLYKWNPKKADWQRLTHCGRYPRAFWSKDGEQIAGVKMGDGKTTLMLLNKQGHAIENLSEFGLGDALGDLDWSPDGSFIVASVKRQLTGWNLERFDLATKTWEKLTQDLLLQSAPRISQDGETVFYIADADTALVKTEGDSASRRMLNVQAYQLTTGETYAISNTTTAIMGFDLSADELKLRVVEYTAKGLQIIEKPVQAQLNSLRDSNELDAEAIPKDVTNSAVVTINSDSSSSDANLSKVSNIEQPKVPAPQVAAFVNTDAYKPESYTAIRDYTPWPSMRPRSWWAWLLADGENNASIQVIVDGSDTLGHHYWQAAPQHFFDKSTLGGDFAYLFNNRLAFLASRDIDSVQDEDLNDNEPEVWDLEHRVQAIYTQPFNSLQQSFQFNVGLAAESIERHIEQLNGRETDSTTKENLLGVMLGWDTTNAYLHSISPEHGRKLSLTLEQYDVFSGGESEGLVTYMDWREFFSFGKSQVLTTRWVEGKADEEAQAFQLGGHVDQFSTLASAIGFGKNEFILRGYPDNTLELTGHRMRVGTLEWRVPLGEIYDGFFVPPIGMGRNAMSVFLDRGAAWNQGESRHYYSGVGVEINPEIAIGYDNLILDVTLGYAYGLDSDLGGSEFYFRLGAGF